jgi:hypothetical protein
MLYKKTSRYATTYLTFDGKKGTEYTVRKDDSEVIVEPATKAVNDTNIDYYWTKTLRKDGHDLIKAIFIRAVVYEK